MTKRPADPGKSETGDSPIAPDSPPPDISDPPFAFASIDFVRIGGKLRMWSGMPLMDMSKLIAGPESGLPEDGGLFAPDAPLGALPFFPPNTFLPLTIENSSLSSLLLK